MLSEKLEELKENYPQNPEFRTWIMKSDLWSWIYSLLIIQGEKVHRTAVVNLIEGKLVDELPLSSYALAQRWQDVYRDMTACIQMQTSLEPGLVLRWARMLEEKYSDLPDGEILRRNTNAVYEWELIPVEESMVEAELTAAIKTYNLTPHDPEDPLARAAALHLKINEIYAFGGDTVSISMAVLMFCLMELGYPLPCLSVDDREYNTMMAEYVDTKDISAFRDMLTRCAYNRLEYVCSLAKHAKEKEENS